MSNQDGFFSSLATFDLGPKPDVSIGEPVSYTPTYGPTTSAVSDFTSLGLSINVFSNISTLPNCVSLQSSVLEVPASLPDTPSPAVVQHPVSRFSTPLSLWLIPPLSVRPAGPHLHFQSHFPRPAQHSRLLLILFPLWLSMSIIQINQHFLLPCLCLVLSLRLRPCPALSPPPIQWRWVMYGPVLCPLRPPI